MRVQSQIAQCEVVVVVQQHEPVLGQARLVADGNCYGGCDNKGDDDEGCVRVEVPALVGTELHALIARI